MMTRLHKIFTFYCKCRNGGQNVEESKYRHGRQISRQQPNPRSQWSKLPMLTNFSSVCRQPEGRKCAVWLQSRLTVGVTDLGLPGAASRKCKPTKPIWAFGIETKDQTCVALSGLSAHAKITFLHDTMQSRQRKIH